MVNMSARSDHPHGKPPVSHPNQQVNGAPGMRSEDYDAFNQYQQQQQVNGYGSTPMMPSPNGDQGYFNYYPQSNQMNSYQTFFGGESGNAWSTGQTGDALAYFGHYTGMTNGTGSDYAAFPSPQYDYTAGGQFSGSGWGYTGDYANNTNWNVQGTQVNGLKPDSSPQYQYAGYGDLGAAYQVTDIGIPANVPVTTPPSNGAVGLEAHNLSLSEPNTVTELGQGMQQLGITNEETETTPSTSESQVVDQSTSGSSISATENSSSSSGPPKAAPESEPVKSSKPMSWAQLASLPAKPAPPKPVVPKVAPAPAPVLQPQQRPVQQSWAATASSGSRPTDPRTSAWTGQQRVQRLNNNSTNNNANSSDARKAAAVKSESEADPTLNKLKKENSYNPKTFDLTAKNARFFVIKSYSEDDIHRAIKYGVWCSTEHGNKRLDAAFRERHGKGPIYLFYSVNGSGHFCGMAEMMSGVDYATQAGVWTQDKWKGSMEIKWIYVKDVPNGHLRHIRLENNENKPVTNSRDTQEVPADKGKQVLKIIHQFKHSTSIFDDFSHYEKKEEEEDCMKKKSPSASSSGASISNANARR